MAVVARTCASLRIFGDDLDPDEITAVLGTQPSRAIRKGEPMQVPPSHPPARTGSWLRSASKADGDNLDAQIEWILSPLTSDLIVWKDLGARFELDMFCGVWMDATNQGTGLSPATMKLLGDRGIPIGLDIYIEDSLIPWK